MGNYSPLCVILGKKNWIASALAEPCNDGVGGDVITNPASSLRGRTAAEAIQKLKFISDLSTLSRVVGCS